MSRIIFIFLLFLAALIRGPLSVLAIFLKNFSRPLKKRIDFERKNLIELQCQSFKLDFLVADYCFEVSSEGELEQVRPLIEYYLLHKKRIEILFSSPSVETKCTILALEFSDQIRLMRLPIASFFPVNFLFFQSPWTWVSAPVVIFCRYDFFPELLSFKFLGKKLILLSAASKKPSWFKSQSIELFSLIVAANNGEARYFKENFPNKKIHAFDFRVPRIFKRVEQSTATLARIVELKSYLKFLDERSPSSKLILGSSWESDLVIIKNSSSNAFWIQDILNNNIHLLIVPHNLGSESVSQLKNSLGLILPNVPVYEISKAHEFEAQILNTSPGIVILNMSGVLCELYTKFSWAYVGGGYERSIHSVLEPFLSGCQVICGPKVNRSTEFDFIKDFAPNEIELLKNAESFYNLMKEKFSKAALKSNERVDLRNKSLALMESIIKEIELC